MTRRDLAMSLAGLLIGAFVMYTYDNLPRWHGPIPTASGTVVVRLHDAVTSPDPNWRVWPLYLEAGDSLDVYPNTVKPLGPWDTPNKLRFDLSLARVSR